MIRSNPSSTSIFIIAKLVQPLIRHAYLTATASNHPHRRARPVVVPNSAPLWRIYSPLCPKSSVGNTPLPTLVQYALAIPITCSISRGASPVPLHAPEAVVFIPTEAALSSPRAWASALSSAPYLVVIGDGALKPYKAFMSIIDGVIFSPVPRRLSSAFITQDREKAVSLVSAAAEDAKDAITIILER